MMVLANTEMQNSGVSGIGDGGGASDNGSKESRVWF
jgi:hypothetical protein